MKWTDRAIAINASKKVTFVGGVEIAGKQQYSTNYFAKKLRNPISVKLSATSKREPWST